MKLFKTNNLQIIMVAKKILVLNLWTKCQSKQEIKSRRIVF